MRRGKYLRNPPRNAPRENKNMSQSPDHIATHRLLMEKEAEIARLLVENAELKARLEVPPITPGLILQPYTGGTVTAENPASVYSSITVNPYGPIEGDVTTS